MPDRRHARQSGSDGNPRRLPRLRLAALPWILLILGTVASWLTSQEIGRVATEREAARFAAAAREAVSLLEAHLEPYQLVTETAAASMGSGGVPTRYEFRTFVSELDLLKQCPGVDGIGYAEHIRAEALATFVSAAEAEFQTPFEVWGNPPEAAEEEGTPPPPTEHVIVRFYERPQPDAYDFTAYDMLSNPPLTALLRSAADAGEVRISQLVSTPIHAGPPRLYLAAPVVRNNSAAGAATEEGPPEGFIVAVLNPGRLLYDLAQGPGPRRVDLKAFDGPQPERAQLLYDSRSPAIAAEAPAQREIARYTSRDQIDAFGQPWAVEFRSNGVFDAMSFASAGRYALIAGVGMTLLLFLLTLRDNALRQRSERIHAELLAREHEARAEAEETAELLRLAEDAASAGVWELDVASGWAKWSESLYRLYGVDPEFFEATLENWMLCIHSEDRKRVEAAMRETIAKHGALNIEYRVSHPRLGERWLLEIGRTFGITEAGRPVRMAGIALDISARKEAEEHQKLLLAELNHRVKNTLAIVQSIASQTLKHAESLESFRDSFEGRLRALARAHGLATQAQWRSIDLRSLVETSLSPYMDGDAANVRIVGPRVTLRTAPALALSLVLHELSTNAAKYGALSTEGGVAEVSWQIITEDQAQMLHLYWQESGGPPVAATGHRGFGSNLIVRSVEYDLGGRTEIDLAPTGLRCELVFPLTGQDRNAKTVMSEIFVA